jgi:hypothetical protein
MMGFGTGPHDPGLAAGSASGIATYCVCLLLTGEVRRAELLSIRRALTHRTG